ncbi:hypothetical protein DICPUDRAFT_74023 [Dictyostelium purpureum]|uniref:EGF-like domain-containing protein n=1 Tax=Dictyostelium purpureum TaxID=5786 RepID=F0Z6J4_DICPU|nr:uncharacterized protein DICPUDRAFT_74023 [Dictyostelium purpureum]EGC40450.1 hypothetical protein DICPUDRAFT_74023 [Dictyostelium purpureum]|eukprot:XP_003282997.1 hypothetical protein DICPUDRAFT_74023 [Dictyostelium purpureum]
MLNNKFINYFILLLLLLFISFNNLVLSKPTLKNVSKPYGTFYKSYLAKYYCDFTIDILCIPTEAGDSCVGLKIGIDSTPTSLIHNNIFSNGTKKVITYLFQFDKVGNFNVVFNDELNIPLQCIALDLNQISFDLMGDYYLGLQKVEARYRVNGLDPYISIVDTTADILGSLSSYCSFYFEYNFGFFYCESLPIDVPFSQIQLKLTTPAETKTFQLNTPVKEKYTLSLNSSYPNEQNLENYNAMGYNYGALLSYKLKEPLNKLFLTSFYKSNIIDIKELSTFVPVSSDETGTTTILTPIERFGELSYDLYYQSQSEITKATPNTLKTNFIQYPLISTPNPTRVGDYDNFLPIVTFGFSDSTFKTDFTPFTFSIIKNRELSYFTRFPYGYVKSYLSPQSYDFQVTSLVKPKYEIASDLKIKFGPIVGGSSQDINFSPMNTTFVYDYNLKPSILKTETIRLGNENSLIRITLNTAYGFSHFILKDLYGGRFYGAETFVSGDLYGIGVYEFTVLNNYNSFFVYDQVSSEGIFFSNSIITNIDDDAFRFYQIPPYAIYQIKDVSFLYNDIDVLNHRLYNVMYFDYSGNIPINSSFIMTNFGTQYQFNKESPIFYSSWNESIKKFQIIFYIEANTAPGPYQFNLVSSYDGQFLHSSSLDTQLIIKKTKLDYQGPIFKEISKILPDTVDGSNVKYGVLGWTVTIEDQINGFDYGYIVIKGQIDKSYYNISLSPEKNIKSGNLNLGVYDIKLNISFPCITQNYVIDEVKLTDRAGRVSYFGIYAEDSKYKSIFNPFLNYLQDSTINKINLQCGLSSASSDSTPPALVFFKSSTSQNSKIIDVGKSSRVITFDFQASDPESGLKNNTFPIVYISNSNNQMIECNSEITLSTETSTTYKCTIDLPIAFGYPGMIIFSVYGFINNNGLFSGYTTQLLINSNFDYFATTSFNSIEPVLTSTSEITEKGGNLWLYGKSLSNTASVYIKYDDSTSFISLQPSTKYSTAILIPGIKPTNKPYQIYVSTGSTTSNIIKVTPIVYDSYLVNCNGNGIQHISTCICNSKWTTINADSQCTIPNHYISSSTQVSPTTGGEITLNGWFGELNNNAALFIDNKSLQFSIISSESIKTTIGAGTIGPIKVNFTQNTITWSGIIYPYYTTEKECSSKCQEHGICDKTTGTCKCNLGYTGFDCSSPINNNNQTETETNNNGTVIIKNQDLGYSIFIDSIIELDINNQQVTTFNLSNNWILANKLESVTTFNQIRANEDSTNATIKLIIEEVNDKDKDFTFAGNQFTVTKGGFKLSLSISNWLFKSNLNTLQVLMTSDIQIDGQNKCNRDNKEATLESSSNNNYLLNNINYLKVIKNNRILYARFQDKMLSDNRPTTIVANVVSNDKKSIKIVLNLPHCDECLIDPDFSLLVSSDYNFECKDSRKWVIAVAVSVSVVGFAVLLVALYFVFKKSTVLKIQLYKFKKQLKNNN